MAPPIRQQISADLIGASNGAHALAQQAVGKALQKLHRGAPRLTPPASTLQHKHAQPFTLFDEVATRSSFAVRSQRRQRRVEISALKGRARLLQEYGLKAL